MSSSFDRFTAYVGGVPKHYIVAELLKENFYWGKDYNNKVVLDTMAGGSYRECMCVEIVDKLQKISLYNNSGSTRKSDTGRNTLHIVQPQMRIVKTWLK